MLLRDNVLRAINHASAFGVRSRHPLSKRVNQFSFWQPCYLNGLSSASIGIDGYKSVTLNVILSAHVESSQKPAVIINIFSSYVVCLAGNRRGDSVVLGSWRCLTGKKRARRWTRRGWLRMAKFVFIGPRGGIFIGVRFL